MASLQALGLASLALLALACGSRSSLVTRSSSSGGSEGGGGSSVTTTTTTTTTTSGGGMGGAGGDGGSGMGGAGASGGGGSGGSGTCVALVVGDTFSLAGGGGYRQMQPSIVHTSDDLQRVTVAAEWVATGGPNNPSELRHASFFPWGPGSSQAIAPSYLADFDGGQSFAIGQVPGAGAFSLLFEKFSGNQPAGMGFIPVMTPDSGSVPASITVDQQADRALFASGQKGMTLVGYGQQLPGGVSASTIGIAGPAPGGGFFDGPIGLACATGRLSVDAVPWGDGWSIALSNGGTLVNAGCMAPFGDPNELQTAYIDPFGGVSGGPSLSGVPGLRRVDMAPRSDGAWITWRANNDEGAAILAVRHDVTLGQLTGPFELKPSGVSSLGASSATSMGDDLLLAWVETPPNGPSFLFVSRFDAAGKLVAQADLLTGAFIQGRISALPSPDGQAVLVAWSEGSGPSEAVQMARFDCVPAP